MPADCEWRRRNTCFRRRRRHSAPAHSLADLQVQVGWGGWLCLLALSVWGYARAGGAEVTTFPYAPRATTSSPPGRSLPPPASPVPSWRSIRPRGAAGVPDAAAAPRMGAAAPGSSPAASIAARGGRIGSAASPLPPPVVHSPAVSFPASPCRLELQPLLCCHLFPPICYFLEITLHGSWEWRIFFVILDFLYRFLVFY